MKLYHLILIYLLLFSNLPCRGHGDSFVEKYSSDSAFGILDIGENIHSGNEDVYRQMNYHILMDTAASQLGVFGPTEILCSYDTYQFPNYERYDAATFSEAHKAEVRNTQFPIDLEKAYELGKRLVERCNE